jgi:thiamine pyrophosphokinase
MGPGKAGFFMMNGHGAVVTGGTIPQTGQLKGLIPAYDWVIAADSGYDNARKLGLYPDLVIGDMDSIASEPDAGIVMRVHPKDKDHTDTELAVLEAGSGTGDYDLIGGGEGRLDHTVSLLCLLSSSRFKLPRVWITAREAVWILSGSGRRSVAAAAVPGTAVSLFTPRGEAASVTSRGLAWELERFSLDRSRASISNRAVCDRIEVSLVSGGPVLLAVSFG